MSVSTHLSFPTLGRLVVGTALAATALLGQVLPAAALGLPDLALRMSAAPNPVAAGGQLTYTLSITNPSYDACPVQRPYCEPIPMGSIARNVKVADTLPAGVTFQSATGDSGFICTQAGGVVTCTGGTVPVDGWSTVMIKVLAPNYGGTLTNSAMVDPNGAISERNEGNNSAAVTSSVNPPPPPPPSPPLSDLTFSGFSQTTGVHAGGYETYTISVRNNGPGAASDIRVNWAADWNNGVPRNITQVTSTTDHGFFCAAPLEDYAGQAVRCVGGSLASGATATITLNILGSNVPLTTVATVKVDPYGSIQETDEGNNQASLTTVFI